LARAHGFSIHVHRTRTAQAHPAAEFGSGQAQRIAQNPEQRCFSRCVDFLGFSVHE
jgi:hypothetical protein